MRSERVDKDGGAKAGDDRKLQEQRGAALRSSRQISQSQEPHARGVEKLKRQILCGTAGMEDWNFGSVKFCKMKHVYRCLGQRGLQFAKSTTYNSRGDVVRDRNLWYPPWFNRCFKTCSREITNINRKFQWLPFHISIFNVHSRWRCQKRKDQKEAYSKFDFERFQNGN